MRAAFERLGHMMRKELIQLVRDRRTFGMTLAMPIVEMLIFGYVVAIDIDHVAIAVCDFDRSVQSRAYVEQLVHSGYFRIAAPCARVGDVDRLLDRGTVTVALTIPPDFSARVKRGQAAVVMAAVDGSNSNTGTIAAAYLEQITLTQAVDVQFADRSGAGRRGLVARHPVVRLEPRVWFNPELRSLHFMVPGIICVLLMESLIFLTALGIAREKEHGTLEQLVVTPIRPVEIILGKALPFVAIGYVNMVLVLIAARVWFRVPVAGSVTLLAALSFLFILTCLGMGLLVSAVSHTQQQAAMAGQFVMLPNLFFSGFMFPISSMPPAVQTLTYVVPLRYYITVVRGIFLKGVGWAELKDEAAILLAFGVLILGLASVTFRKQIT